MRELKNPLLVGEYNFEEIIYAHEDLSYPDSLAEYKIFENPDGRFTTKRISLVPFGYLPKNHNWPFEAINVPLNGVIYLPKGQEKFPLMIIAHGNHDPLENSTIGYGFLGELMASQGVIFVSIDANFLNGRNSGENDARAILHLEHLKQFKEWSIDPSHPLYGKIDFDKIIVIGHSRGGEGVGHLSFFNRLSQFQPESYTPPINFDGTKGFGPYNFNISAIISIAPTHNQYQPFNKESKVSDNYFIIHGSADNDVSDFQGYLTYDKINGTNNQIKALLWVHGANHNYFNSHWKNEAQIATITRKEQENILKLYVACIKIAMFDNELEYIEVFTNIRSIYDIGWVDSTITLSSQYESADKFVIQDFQNQKLELNSGLTGSIENEYVELKVRPFYFEKNYPQIPGLSIFDTSKHLYQDTNGLVIRWNQPEGYYKIKFNPSEIPFESFNTLTFRVGQSFEQENIYSKNQDFSIVISDLNNKQGTFSADSLASLVYPAKAHAPSEPKTVMQTLNLNQKLIEKSGVDYLGMTRISFQFNRSDSGKIYVDNIQLTNKNHGNEASLV